jgi:hypothetical protein
LCYLSIMFSFQSCFKVPFSFLFSKG